MLISMQDEFFVHYFQDLIITQNFVINNSHQGQTIVLTALHNLQHTQQLG